MKISKKSIKAEINNQKDPTGFTMLGLIVSIFIISVGLSAIMNLINSVVASSSASVSRLVAANLAQEGIEVVKNIRDFNYNPTNGWDAWYAGIVSADYLVQYNDTALRSYANTFLNYNAASGLYGFDVGGGASIYKRKISLTKISNVEVGVVAEVAWSERGRNYKITVEDRLWNWR